MPLIMKICSALCHCAKKPRTEMVDKKQALCPINRPYQSTDHGIQSKQRPIGHNDHVTGGRVVQHPNNLSTIQFKI